MRKALAVYIGLVLALSLSALEFGPPMAQYRTSSGFGLRDSGYRGGTVDSFHPALDLVAPEGEPVNAVAGGWVVQVYPPPGVLYGGRYYQGHPSYGGMVIIQHSADTFSRSGHLSKVTVAEGDYVLKGKPIGVIGNTGESTGTHLHLAIYRRPPIPPEIIAVRVNPLDTLLWNQVTAWLAEPSERRNSKH